MYATSLIEENFDRQINKNSSVGRKEKLKHRAEKNIAIMNKIQELIGDDIPWANEEEMIKELAEMRRQSLRS